MCERCDGATFDELLERIGVHIRTHGWAVQAVDSGLPGRDWGYTIGLLETFGHPELIVTGYPALDSHAILDGLAGMVAHGEVLLPGETAALGPAAHPVHCFRLVPVHERHLSGDLFAMWHAYYRDAGTTLDALHAATIDPHYCSMHQRTVNWLDNPGAVVGASRRARRSRSDRRHTPRR